MPHLTVVFSRSATLGSPIIRAADRWGQWSHCGLIVGPDVIEARAFHGVVRTPWRQFVDRASKFDERYIEVPDPAAGVAWAEKQIGKGYDYGALFSNLLRENLQSRSRYDCAELLESAVVAAGRERFRCPRWKLSPNLLYIVT